MFIVHWMELMLCLQGHILRGRRLNGHLGMSLNDMTFLHIPNDIIG